MAYTNVPYREANNVIRRATYAEATGMGQKMERERDFPPLPEPHNVPVQHITPPNMSKPRAIRIVHPRMERPPDSLLYQVPQFPDHPLPPNMYRPYGSGMGRYSTAVDENPLQTNNTQCMNQVENSQRQSTFLDTLVNVILDLIAYANSNGAPNMDPEMVRAAVARVLPCGGADDCHIRR
jgi:hypothetical protein